ncbi:hypothetical protein [Stakelama marina]|uniref:Uncharacterized protein n=1 Tax=Stakelama marina TaxID=2826939 RepID=A0A8T4IFG9_9SPHN|nr:hypothetical protein [Stakelama marina]MBR0553758.1 hypothetical protein [Stakelama marina]
MPFPPFTGQSGATEFEQMRRDASTTLAQDPHASFKRPRVAEQTGPSDLVVVDTDEIIGSDSRFVRTEVGGKPAIALEERAADGSWRVVWNLPSESADAREGMMGWLNTQQHRWSRFATMYHRRGGDELTQWIFELMVVPTTAAARAPRLEPGGGSRQRASFAPRPASSVDIGQAIRYGRHADAQNAYRSQTASRPRPVWDDGCSCRGGGVRGAGRYTAGY